MKPIEPSPIGRKRVAWVLGAGFSAPLGGPLLNDFFSAALNTSLRLQQPEQFTADAIAEVASVFGQATERADLDSPRPWRNAEEFLDYVETAALNKDSRAQAVIRHLAKKNEQTPEKIAKAARRILAAQSCLFLASADPKTERWSPFVRWASQLSSWDEIVTFNYDVVLEMLSAVRHAAGGSHFVFEPPKDALFEDGAEQLYDSTKGDGPRVLKMHGSATWAHRGPKIAVYNDPSTSLADAVSVALGAPGPSKQNACETWLQPVWQRGINSIMGASKVVFVGYRFPETDAKARADILGALAGSNADELDVVVILGSDVSHPHVRRIQGLLEFALRQRRLEVHVGATSWSSNAVDAGRVARVLIRPLFTQDYLSLVDRVNADL